MIGMVNVPNFINITQCYSSVYMALALERQESMTCYGGKGNLLQLLLRSDVVRVATLALATIGRFRVKTSIASEK